MTCLLDLGADGIMTDDTVLLRDVLAERGQWHPGLTRAPARGGPARSRRPRLTLRAGTGAIRQAGWGWNRAETGILSGYSALTDLTGQRLGRQYVMAERALRGTRLGATSYENDRNTDLAPRREVAFDCPKGHHFTRAVRG